jgi:hypothetical protein
VQDTRYYSVYCTVRKATVTVPYYREGLSIRLPIYISSYLGLKCITPKVCTLRNNPMLTVSIVRPVFLL